MCCPQRQHPLANQNAFSNSNENREREEKKNQWKEDKQISQDQPKENSQSLLHKISDKWILCVRETESTSKIFFPYFSVWASHCLGPREAHSLSSLSMMNDQVCVQLCECVCFSAFLVNMYAKLHHKIWLCCFSVLFSISISWWLFFSLFLSFSIYQSDGMKSEQKLMQIMLLMYQALLLQSVLY